MGGDSTSMYSMDRHKYSRVRPAPRLFNSAKQLLEFNAEDCVGRMFMLQHKSLYQDMHVLHMKMLEKPKDDRIVVLSSGHLAIMKPTSYKYTFDTLVIVPLSSIGDDRSVSENVVRLTVKGKHMSITLSSSKEVLQFLKNLDICLNDYRENHK